MIKISKLQKCLNTIKKIKKPVSISGLRGTIELVKPFSGKNICCSSKYSKING